MNHLLQIKLENKKSRNINCKKESYQQKQVWCDGSKERQANRQTGNIVIIVILPECRNRIHGQLKEYHEKRRRNMKERLKTFFTQYCYIEL